ncbi:Vitelline membrane outer layer protein 1 [Chionoecetes opilio]|uniref:Vitelline membrane outer layer protein 1 n=1 Tax=Chionoecetes opilio TaxID=41210 RepID=A0A8J4XZK6_CHIOP|nr:Vitelline membrane outer layer protein 1 [Chionoecetes opilio]
MCGSEAAARVIGPKTVAESLTIDNGLNRGEWGPIQVCSQGAYVFAFEIKYSGVGFVDDTSVNAIRLYCETPTGSLTDLITSSEGSYGQWRGMRACPHGAMMTGMRANVVPDMGVLGDDLGIDNLQMKCAGGEILDGQHGVPNMSGQDSLVTRELTQVGNREMEAVHMKIRQSADARDYGDWGLWKACSPGNKVCGLETRLQDGHTLEDDAGLTDVIMYCCN